MAPPLYSDLGKQARDLLSKNYHHGLFQVETSTKPVSNSNVEFKTNLQHSIERQILNGSLDIKYKIPQQGLVLTEKIKTDSSFNTIVEFTGLLSHGVKLTFDSLYALASSKHEASIKSEYLSDNARVNANLFLLNTPIFCLSGVLKRDGVLLGAHSKFDLSTNQAKNTGLSLGYQTFDYTLHSYTNNGVEFGASFYHRVHKNLELGAQVVYVNGDQKTDYAIGGVYHLSPELSVRAKADNKSVVGLAATHSLSTHLKATISSQFSLATVTAGHKLGFGLEYSG